ncbi:pilus assembly protein [Croceicoccus ponticola]|uniref:Pilus assembly protein n=2 Tax=Croceicoccus ponticola TaxID=2217664 RepID=A0A437H0C9_9SPHN|nr:pilus assembly protein [Croceicoccus ponticola]
MPPQRAACRSCPAAPPRSVKLQSTNAIAVATTASVRRNTAAPTPPSRSARLSWFSCAKITHRYGAISASVRTWNSTSSAPSRSDSLMQLFLTRLQKDDRGVSAIETAILLPVLVTMLIGVLQIGLYLQAQNAVRSVGGEMSRFMTVESQKHNQVTNQQIEDTALGIAVSAPYILKSSQLDIEVADSTVQNIDRVRQVDVKMSYTVPNILGFADWDVMTIDYTRKAFIPLEPPAS